MGDERDLGFPLYNPQYLDAITPDGLSVGSDFTWPVSNPDEKVSLVVNLSLNEFIYLASVIDIGGDIASNDNSVYAWWLWNRIFNMDDLCTAVNNCLPDSDNYQALLYVANPASYPPDDNTTWNIYYPNNGLQNNVAPDPIPGQGEDCKDYVWSGIREIIQRLDEQGRDLLEQLISFQDKAERMSRLVELIPILGSVLDTIGEYLADVIPDILNAYNAYSDPATLDIIACDLFDMVCSQCRYPTYDEIFDYLQSNSYASFPEFTNVTLRAIVQELGLSYLQPPAVVWFTVTAFQAYIYGLDAKFIGGYGKNTFKVWASLGEDLPTDNWSVLCSGCQPQPFDSTLTFTQANSAKFDLQLGQQNTNALAVVDPDRKVIVDIPFSENQINEIRVQLCRSNTRGASLVIKGYNGANEIFNHNYGQPFVGCPQWITYNNADADLTRIRLEYYWNWLGDALYAIRLIGLGSDPFA